jgi:hypothetical protein
LAIVKPAMWSATSFGAMLRVGRPMTTASSPSKLRSVVRPGRVTVPRWAFRVVTGFMKYVGASIGGNPNS